MEFILSEEVEPLKFNFAPYGPEGIIPEPSAAQIQNFRMAVAAMFNDAMTEQDAIDLDKAENAMELRRIFVATIGKDQTASQQKALQTIADVCSDTPSFDVLNALPWRHQQAFSGWISGVFLLPQTSTPATTR
jgi:hypothetical protein